MSFIAPLSNEYCLEHMSPRPCSECAKARNARILEENKMLLRQTLQEERPETPVHVDPLPTEPICKCGALTELGHSKHCPQRRRSIDDATPAEWDAAARAAQQAEAERKLVRLTLPASVQQTPEVRAWVTEVEKRLELELRDQLFNLLVWGVTTVEHKRGR